MSPRPSTPSQKIVAVAGTFVALRDELGMNNGLLLDPIVTAAIIDAAVEIAMHTDTRDMGILAGGPIPVRPAEQQTLPEGYDPEDPYARE